MALLARQYTSASALTAAKVDIADLAADDIRDLISFASEYIETLTDQFFNPVEEIRSWDGRGRSIAYDPQLIPIVKVNSVSIDYDRVNYRNQPLTPNIFEDLEGKSERLIYLGMLGATAITSTDLVVHNRFIELVGTYFPGGARSVYVNGVFGWLENKDEVSTTIDQAAGLATNGTTVTVASSTGFATGDVALIGTNLYVIITGIPDATTLNFDSIGTLDATIADGTTVKTWGKVPLGIRNLCNHIVADFVAENQARDDAVRHIEGARIKKEFTDRYMYELFGPRDNALGSLTGSIRHDMTVRKYSRPAMAGLI